MPAPTSTEALTQFLLRMGDNTLILGHRVSEWCGHAPVLEEDIALANTALDLIGQTQMWLGLAWDFRNLLLVEMPNGDFGQTLMRQFLFDAWHSIQLGRLMKSSDERVAAIAEKASKEVAYHLERSADTVVGLGDGTPESHARMQAALVYLWPYVGEMFQSDAVDGAMVASGIAPDPATLRDEFDALVGKILATATLTIPEDAFGHKGGRNGAMHTEHLGHLLTQMQWLQRAYPGSQW